MAETMNNGGGVTRIISAPRSKVYAAFLDAEAVAEWMAPGTMRGHVHSFDARVGGQFRISLTYQDADDDGRGKSDSTMDTYHGHFAELIPDEKVVEVIEFETDDPAFAGEMTMIATLADAPEGTEVTLRYENVPPGIRPEDNDLGSRIALDQLAALLEQRPIG